MDTYLMCIIKLNYKLMISWLENASTGQVCPYACTHVQTNAQMGGQAKNTMLRWPIKSIKRKFMHFMDKILSLDDMLNEDPRSGYSK